MKRKLKMTSVLTVPLKDANKLLESGDGDGVLLYLHLLKNNGELDLERAAKELRLSVRAVDAAAVRLTRLGILSNETSEPRLSEQTSEYKAHGVVQRTQSDPEFEALLEETQATLGQALSMQDIKRLFGIYDQLALPVDVIMLLIHHCKEEHEMQYGTSRSLSFLTIERKAYAWYNRDIVTYEKAEEWLTNLSHHKALAIEIQRAIGLNNRELSPTERKYIETWIEMGFGPDALALAADKTIAKTGELKWRYMNSIVLSWSQKNLHTVDEIEKNDRKLGKGPKGQTATTEASNSQELERLRTIRQKIQKGQI